MPDIVQEELQSRDPELLQLFEQRDGAARLLTDLPARFSPEEISKEGAVSVRGNWSGFYTVMRDDTRKPFRSFSSYISAC